jgi:hypothetical protein
MAHGRLGSGVVVLAILVIASAVVVRAQTGCAAQSDVSDDVLSYCEGYLVADFTPVPTCCMELSTVQNVWGSDCYCDLLLYWQQNPDSVPVDMTQAYMLPQACNVTANMTNCPAAPPSTSTSSPPSPAALLPPPAGLTPTPPGFTPPTIPGFALPSPPSKGLVPAPPCNACTLGAQVSARVSCRYRAGIESISPTYGVGINRKYAH